MLTKNHANRLRNTQTAAVTPEAEGCSFLEIDGPHHTKYW